MIMNNQDLFFSDSDKDLKENLVVIPNALTKVGLMTGYTYDWKNHTVERSKYNTKNFNLAGESDTGVIAQDVELLGLPGITTTRDNGTKAVKYERLVPVLIEAIKELKAENDALKARVTTLEG
tara:strand:+ start:234 stop:602 length:369 start_codon:yes stop_codon:yes gene_type:complete